MDHFKDEIAILRLVQLENNRIKEDNLRLTEEIMRLNEQMAHIKENEISQSESFSKEVAFLKKQLIQHHKLSMKSVLFDSQYNYKVL